MQKPQAAMAISSPWLAKGARAATATVISASMNMANGRRGPNRPSRKATTTPLTAPPSWNRELAPAAALAEKPEASSNSGIQLVSMKRLSRLAANISQSRGVTSLSLPANRAP